jgi:hypothetical protein
MKKLIIICAALLLASPAWGWFITGNSDYTNPYSTDAYTRGLWHFDETSGDCIFVDASGNNSNGEIGRAPWVGRQCDRSETMTWQTSMAGFGNAFTGGYVDSVYNGGGAVIIQADTWTMPYGTSWMAKDYEETYTGRADGQSPLGFAPGTDMTIEFWMNPNATGGSGWTDIILEKYTGGDYSLYYYENKIVYRCYKGGWKSLTAVDTVPLDVWTHVAVCVDRTSSDTDLIAFFYNGQIGSEGWALAPYSGHGGNADGKPLLLSTNYQADSYKTFQGQLDELRISDVCRFIPEPTTLSLLVIGALAFFRRKK